jgi:hypothetical protein
MFVARHNNQYLGRPHVRLHSALLLIEIRQTGSVVYFRTVRVIKPVILHPDVDSSCHMLTTPATK